MDMTALLAAELLSAPALAGMAGLVARVGGT